MGKWCEVKCSCDNREPVYSSDKYNEYECGHKSGIYIGLPPNDLLRIGYALQKAFTSEKQPFEVFSKISYFQNYEDEHLILTANERDLWEIEIQELKKYINNEKFMNWDESRRFHLHLEEKDLLAVFFDKLSLNKALQKILADGLSLIKASLTTENPIEFFL